MSTVFAKYKTITLTNAINNMQSLDTDNSWKHMKNLKIIMNISSFPSVYYVGVFLDTCSGFQFKIAYLSICDIVLAHKIDYGHHVS